MRLTQLLSLVLTDSASERVRKNHEQAIKELQAEIRKLYASGVAGADGADGASGFGDYAMVALSANQTARLTGGNHIEFDQISRRGTSVSLSTGTEQANGLITLAAGKTYLLQSFLGSENLNIANYQFTDHSDDSVLIGDTTVRSATHRLAGQNATTAIAGLPGSAILVSPSSSLTVKMERTAGGNGPSAIHEGSRIWVQEVA